MTLGFIGLGQMGGPMARNLAAAGEVLAYDASEDVCAYWRAQGLTVVASLEALAEVDVLILCVPNAGVADAVLFGAGLAAKLARGTVVIDTSTAEHGATLALAAQLEDMGLRFMDAPVSGMAARAEDATLTVMCGGSVALFEECAPPLASMASTVLHVGDVGAGQLSKLVNQLLFDINIAGLAEILPIAVKLGLEPEQIGAVINSGTGRSFASEFFIPEILQGRFDQGYSLDNAHKDLVSAEGIVAKNDIDTPVLAAATATYRAAISAGHGAKDKGAMILEQERALGVAFRSAKRKQP